MSEFTTPDPVELVRRQFEAANRRDLDRVTSSFAPDAVFEGRAVGAIFEGRAAIRSFLEDWFGAYEELEVGLEEVRDLGNGVVFAVVIQNGRLASSAGHLRQREGWVFVWVRGLIARLTASDIDEARAAAERLAQEPDLVELVRQANEALNRRDFDAAMSFVAPDAVFDMSFVALGSFEGREAIRRFVEDWWGAYEEFEQEAEEVLDLGNGVTLAVFSQKGRPAGSTGQVTEVPFAQVSTWVDGVVVRITSYRDIDEARAAAERLAGERE